MAPASAIDRDLLDAGCAALESFGYQPFYLPSILDRELFFAGAAERRVRELEEMFLRPEVRAVLCARGGYGANYLLGRVNLDVVRSNPKIFIGYSDVTTLLTWFCDALGLVTFHGPMLTKDFAAADGVDADSLESATSGDPEWAIAPPDLQPLAPGVAEGELYGGCLSMLAASLGTPYEVQTEGRILFLEDIAAKPYQVDRMLMQLKLAGKLDGVAGIIFGEMRDCVQPSGQDYTLQEVVLRALSGLRVPIAYGLRSGHVTRGNITLPIGVRAHLEVGARSRLCILESATAAAAEGARP